MRVAGRECYGLGQGRGSGRCQRSAAGGGRSTEPGADRRFGDGGLPPRPHLRMKAAALRFSGPKGRVAGRPWTWRTWRRREGVWGCRVRRRFVERNWGRRCRAITCGSFGGGRGFWKGAMKFEREHW